jgi:hypothetical protein
MKTCSRCQLQKPMADFNRSSRSPDGHQGYCRDCQKAHYRANAVRHRRNVRRTALMRLKRFRALLYDAMKEGCVDCGVTDLRVLEFDHVRGDKLANVSKLIRYGSSRELVLAEIAKCDVRCKNCHAIVTAERRGIDWRFDYL